MDGRLAGITNLCWADGTSGGSVLEHHTSLHLQSRALELDWDSFRELAKYMTFAAPFDTSLLLYPSV